MTLRTLIQLAMSGKYNLDKPIRFEMLWTDYVKEYLPKEELLYMPVENMRQYDWAVVLEMGKEE